MRALKFSVSNNVLVLGIKILTARISDVKNEKLDSKLDKFLEKELSDIKQLWEEKSYKDDPILQGFRNLHTKVGRSNRKYVASPEVLLRLFLEKDRFPRINKVVDIYNFISLKSRLALGAHDVGHVQGDITLRLTNGDETFIPLGSKSPITVPAGEYSYIDDANSIICRMEVLQVESTKVTLDTNEVFLIIQGNENTDNAYVEKTAKEVTDLLTKFCGGKSR